MHDRNRPFPPLPLAEHVTGARDGWYTLTSMACAYLSCILLGHCLSYRLEDTLTFELVLEFVTCLLLGNNNDGEERTSSTQCISEMESVHGIFVSLW